MSDKRIIHVDSIDEAASIIRRDFKGSFPIPMRGIITSLDGVVDLSKPGYNFVIKEPHQILHDGTELDCNLGITRVEYWFGKGTNLPLNYAGTRHTLNYYAGVFFKARKELLEKLKPALLVYDSSLIIKDQPFSYEVHLPRSARERSKAILTMYINNTTSDD